jgi:hypothetical protein
VVVRVVDVVVVLVVVVGQPVLWNAFHTFHCVRLE